MQWRLDYSLDELSNAHFTYMQLVDMFSAWLSGKGQAGLCLFQKHLLCWEYIHNFSQCRRF